MEETIFKRKIYDELLEWKERSKGRSALLIEGARRVGKTTIAKLFAKQEYSDSIYIDFSKDDQRANELFRDLSDIDEFYRKLFLYAGKSLKARDGLIILDEIQFNPRARMAVKFLSEDGRYDVIETGSLLSIKHRRKKGSSPYMIPSEEERIEMHPLDFEEFCLAMGDDPSVFSILSDIAKGTVPLRTISEPIHRKWMEKVRRYVALGGMPAVLSRFLETNSFYDAHRIKQDIVKLYRDDLSKLDREEGTRCREVYDDIHIYMRETSSSRFQIKESFGEGRGPLLPTTLTDISDSKTVNVVHACLDISPGMGLTKDDSAFKVYANDVGLFSALFLEGGRKEDILDYYRRLEFGDLNANLGSLYEHFVLQNLVAAGSHPYYHYFQYNMEEKEKRYEVDFLLYRQGKIVPVEVKSGRFFKTSSLEAFKKKYSSRINVSYVLSPKMPKKEGNTLFLPLYFAGLV